MLTAEDDSAMQADAYIDSLLAGHARRPSSVPEMVTLMPRGVRDTIGLLERLPRFHPSFLFEEALAGQLRDAAAGVARRPDAPRGELVRLPVGALGAGEARLVADRRLLVGGAIASGFSLAGLAGAYMAWRRRRRPYVS
jgi:hypothetical protein